MAGNRDIYFRANVFEKDGVSLSPNHEGTHWVRIEQPKDAKIIFKQVKKSDYFRSIFKFNSILLKVECTEDTIWAVDKDNTIWFKRHSNVDSFLNPHYNFTLYGDQPEFSMYKFPERATTYKINSGGWALYTEPHFQGELLNSYLVLTKFSLSWFCCCSRTDLSISVLRNILVFDRATFQNTSRFIKKLTFEGNIIQ